MAFSRLPGCEDLSYPTLARLESDDVNYSSNAYELSIKGINVTIAFGKVKREFENEPYEVIYYPIYLLHKYSHDVIRKIGVVEYLKSDTMRLDENLELDVLSTPFRPIIFQYITADLLKVANMKSVDLAKRSAEEKRKKRENIRKGIDGEKGESGTQKVKGAPETPKKITLLASNVDAVTPITDLRNVVNVDSIEDVDPSSSSDSGSEHNPGPGSDAEKENEIRDVILPTQTKALADKERAEYVKSGPNSGTEIWIQQFMKNRHFGIQDNEGGNDSLFACVRDGLLSQGNTTLRTEHMRVKLASMATKELFQEYVKYYNKYVTLYKQTYEQYQDLNKQEAALKERIKGKHLSPNELLKVKSEHARLLTARKEKKERVDFLKEIVSHQYGYMRDTKGEFENFKTVMSTRTFVPDQWTLRALERAYNISIIRMSESRFKSGDLDNVIICGDNADDAPGLGLSMITASTYKPSVFIVVSVDEHNTYRLIQYRSKGSFSFSELPYDIRTQIITKCIEHPHTEFAFLPQFKRVLEIYPKSVKGTSSSQDGGGLEMGGTRLGGDDGYKGRDIPIFQIYNKSGTDKPGHGPGEYIPSGMKHLFTPLLKFPNWRRALTNMAESPFILDGRTWFTVEHYYQGCKFKKHNHDFYLQFSMDSKSEISKNPELAKAAGSDSGIFKGVLYRPKAVTIDRDFFSSGRGTQALASAVEAKFRQNADMRNILLATLNAKIYHFQRGERPVLFKPLMQTRAKLESAL
jgi:predicted NAD-dependent protein-ADP-ribosyltransferase YbiA (DUF1768 family)